MLVRLYIRENKNAVFWSLCWTNDTTISDLRHDVLEIELWHVLDAEPLIRQSVITFAFVHVWLSDQLKSIRIYLKVSLATHNDDESIIQ